MSQTQTSAKLKPITENTIPGTDVPDISKAETESDRQKRWMSRVAVSTAVMAAFAAISTMFAGGNLNQAMFQQINQADRCSEYQAKGIKRSVVQTRVDIAAMLDKPVSDTDRKDLTRYTEEQEKISAEAKSFGATADRHLIHYRILAAAAAAFQIGIALAAVALLLKRNVFWLISLGVGAVGVVLLAAGFLA